MRYYALIGGQNEVVGIVSLEESQIADFSKTFAQVIDITDQQPMPQIGWSFDGQSIVGTSPSKKITKLAMLQRLTVPERLGILTYVGANPASVPAMLLQNIMVTTFVDLSRADTQAGIQVLVQLGLLTQDRATTILTSPVSAAEAYNG